MMQGGRDVVGSAARAVPFDRSAVSDKAANDSPERANEVPASGRSSAREDDVKSREDPNRLYDWRDHAEIARVTAGETAHQFQAKASEDNGAIGKATMRRADSMTGEASRVGTGRTVPATSEGKDATAGRDRHLHSNSSVPIAEPTMPEAAKTQAPRPAVSGAFSPWSVAKPHLEPVVVQHSLEERLERAERELICAQRIDNWHRCQQETARYTRIVADLKRQIAERDAEVSHA